MPTQLFESLESRRLLASAAGSPDLSFGAAGQLTGSVALAGSPRYASEFLRGVSFYGVNSLALPDGGMLTPLPRVIVDGSGRASDGSGIVRFRADGSIDTLWGVKGVTPLPGASDGATSHTFSLRRDGVGRIYVLRDGGRVQGITLTRLTTTGRIDDSFAGGVPVTLPIRGDYDGTSDANFELDGRGRPVVIGRDTETLQPVILRFTSAGVLDATFDGDGVLPVAWYGDVATDASSRIALAWFRRRDEDDRIAFEVIRVGPSGQLDRTFGDAGTADVDVVDDNGQWLYYPELLPRSDGGYTVVGFGDQDATLRLWQLDARGAIDRTFGTAGLMRTDTIYGAVPGNGRIALTSNGEVLIHGIVDASTSEFGQATVGRVVRLARSGRVLSDVLHPRLAADIAGGGVMVTAEALRPDGSVVGILTGFNIGLASGEPGSRVVGMAAWRANGARDGSVRTLSRMAIRDVVTVSADGRPIFSFADPLGSFAGRADRLGDGTYRPRTSTLATSPSTDWKSGFGRVFAVNGNDDATILEANGISRLIYTGGTLSMMPRNFASLVRTNEDGSFGTRLIMPSGRLVHGIATPSNATSAGRVLPQRVTDNAFYSPRTAIDFETGEPLPGIELLNPNRELVRPFGTDGAVSGVSDPWFADSRGRLLYFGPDRKALHRLTRSGQPDVAYSAVPVDGWKLDIDSRDRLIAWRVVPTSGPSSGEVQVRRYTVDGAIDASFGKNGEARVRHWLGQGSTADVYLDSADNVMVVTIDRTSSPRVKWAATKLLGTSAAAAARAAIAVGQAKSAARAGVWSEVDVAAAVLA